MEKKFWQEIASHFRVAALIFGLGIISGIITIALIPGASEQFLDSFFDFGDPVLEYARWQLFLFIFLNNAVKTFMSMILGMLFGIAPAFFLYVNGYALGALGYAMPDLRLFVAGIFPHGIIEIPAVLGGSALGLLLGSKALKKTFRHENHKIEDTAVKGFYLFLKIIIPLLILSAAIETFITPVIMRWYS